MKDAIKTSVFDMHDAVGLAELVKSGEVSASELLDEAIERVEKADDALHLLSARDYDFAQEQIKKGLPEGPFTGVPFLRKDEGCEIEGLATTAGLGILKEYKSTETRTLSKRYMQSGLVMMGATKVPPFCATIDSDRAPYGACLNPWDKTRTPGGSSSGAGAVVGAGALPMAHGNDGGGSLRIPAAWCGAFTMKSSRGRVHNGPVHTEGWMGFATEGTITRSVRDGAVSLDVIMGGETGVRCTAPAPARPYGEEINHPCRKLRIAVQEKTHFGTDFHPDHQKGLSETVKLLESLGHEVVAAAPNIDPDRLSQVLYNCVAVNVDTVLQDIGVMRGKPVGDDELEVFIRTWRGAAKGVTASEYARITEVAMEEAYNFDLFMKDFDAVVSPTMTELPLKIGEIYRHEADFDSFRTHQNQYLAMTQVQNVTGQPAMSVPLHWTEAGMPVGMMFVGRYGDESTLFSLAAQLENAAPWWDRKALF